jgi:hypothetical protein
MRGSCAVLPVLRCLSARPPTSRIGWRWGAVTRFALQATALGIRNAFVNQPIEVAALRPHFATAMGLGNERPDLIVRFGRGPLLPRSLRRPLEAVLV